MSWIVGKIFGKGGETPATAGDGPSDVLADNMPQNEQEEMFCFTMGDCELHTLKAGHGGQVKACEFMRASLHITSMVIDSGEEDGSGRVNIPLVVASNDDYDEDQEQQREEKLPLTEELIFMKYSDGAEASSSGAAEESKDNFAVENMRAGYVFFYPSLGLCKVIECEVATELQAEELQQFEEWVCKVLYATNEQTPIRANLNPHAMAQQGRLIKKYCIQASLDVLLRKADIGDIFAE